MTDEDLRAQIFMMSAVLILLLDKAREMDPNFDDFARRQFDILLGMLLKERGSPGEIERKAREHFLGLLRAAWGDLRIDPDTRSLLNGQPKRLTWRRRLLVWLERG